MQRVGAWWGRLSSLPFWATALLLGGVALLLRGLHLADFFTVDESFHWVWRVRHFAGAIRQERWFATNLTGHPGITTLWLGMVGRWLALRLDVPTEGMAAGSAAIGYLAWLRLPLAVVNSLAVVAGYLLLRRLIAPGAALLAGLLWAGSPFLVAHSRLLHLDALLTSFMVLSLLLLLTAIEQMHTSPPQSRPSRGRVRVGVLLPLVASGLCAGLALLTKAPSLLLLPVAGLTLLLFVPLPVWQRLRWIIPAYLLWLVCAFGVFVALWPAMWQEAGAAIAHIIAEIVDNGALPHHTGNYFLGQPVADPGGLFYPAVIIWRSLPVTLIGLLLLPLALRQPGRERRVLLALLLFALLFLLALSLLPKKFDRYLLPIWPALLVVAAAGWHHAAGWLGQRWPPAERFRALVLAGVGLLLAGTALWYHPYYLAYYNPLVGGGKTAQHVLLVGWGEGMPQVGAWLRQRPDVQRSPVLAWDPRTLEPFIPVRTVFLNERSVAEPASYAVLYARSMQRQDEQAAQEYVQQSPPLYTVQMYGIDYAAVYQPPYPFEQPADAVFGGGLHLRGSSQQLVDQTLVLTTSWNIQPTWNDQPAEDQRGGWFCFVHVLDEEYTRVAQVDVPIDGGLFATWQAGQQFGGPLPIALPPDLPAGTYQVVLGVYNPAGGTRLPLVAGAALPPAINGAHVLKLTTFTYRP